jgi:hypothetical protein
MAGPLVGQSTLVKISGSVGIRDEVPFFIAAQTTKIASGSEAGGVAKKGVLRLRESPWPKARREPLKAGSVLIPP